MVPEDKRFSGHPRWVCLMSLSGTVEIPRPFDLTQDGLQAK